MMITRTPSTALFSFQKDNEAQIWQNIKDNVNKFKDKPRLIFGSKSKNGMVDNNFFPIFSILYTLFTVIHIHQYILMFFLYFIFNLLH